MKDLSKVYKDKTVLVIGGAGFVGAETVSQLLDLGAKVVVIDNLSVGKKKNIDRIKEVIFYKKDIRNKKDILNIFNSHRPDYVVHLAAIHYIPYSDAHPLESMQVNLMGTMNIIDACRAVPPQAFLFASSVAVYSPSRTPHAEDAEKIPREIYGYTKLVGEALVESGLASSSVRTFIARFSNAFGHGETNPHLMPEIAMQLKKGNTVHVGNLHPKRDYIHVSDLVEGILHTMTIPEKFEILNIATDTAHSVKDVLKFFEKNQGKKIKLIQKSSRKRKVDRPHLQARIDKLTKLTGWKPSRSLSDSIADAFNYAVDSSKFK